MIDSAEVIAICYMLVSSICFAYQLRSESFVTVDCRGLWVYCLESKEHHENVRYVLNGKDIESRCNNQGSSVLFQAFLLMLVGLEILIFVNVIYKYRIRTTMNWVSVDDKDFLTHVYALVTITGIQIGVFIILPLLYYSALSKAMQVAQGENLFFQIVYSPLRALFSLIITVTTAPLMTILQKQFSTGLYLDNVYPNFTCVSPVVDGTTGVHRCPAERAWLVNLPEPSACESSFYCANDCLVILPRIIMSSLSVILASFVLCYRLLKLRHATTHGMTRTSGLLAQKKCRNSAIVAQKYSCGNASGVEESLTVARREMKEKVNGNEGSMGAAASDEHRVCNRELMELNRNTNQSHSEQHNMRNVNEKETNQQHDESLKYDEPMNVYSSFRKRSGKNGAKTLTRNNNGVVRNRRKVSFQNGALEEFDVYSSGEEHSEVTLVEDESEYYMSGFRL